MRTALAGLALALLIAAMLLLGTGVVDRAVLGTFYAGGHEIAVRAALVVTAFGSVEVLLPAAIIATLILFVRRQTRAAALLIGICLSGRMVIELLKALTARARPDIWLQLTGTHSDSFPSAHSGNSAMVWLSLALFLTRTPRSRAVALAAAGALSLLVGVSRLMLGVHWPSDVAAGWSFGLLWIGLWLRLTRYRLEPPLSAS